MRKNPSKRKDARLDEGFYLISGKLPSNVVFKRD